MHKQSHVFLWNTEQYWHPPAPDLHFLKLKNGKNDVQGLSENTQANTQNCLREKFPTQPGEESDIA